MLREKINTILDEILAKVHLIRVHPHSRYLTYRRDDAESGGYYIAAQALLICLQHIQQHRMSHPIGVSKGRWFNHIVPEMIWFLSEINEGKMTTDNHKRYRRASRYLGQYFSDIWC